MRIWVTLQTHDNSEIEVVFGSDEGPHLKYHVGAQTLRNQVTTTREVLSELTRAYTQQDPKLKRETMVKLAREGSRLRHVLIDSPRIPKNERKRLNDLINEGFQHDQAQLKVQVGPSTCFPLGLLYDGDPEAAAGSDRPNGRASGFWAEKVRVSHMITTILPSAFAKPFERAKFSMISVVNRDVFNGAIDLVERHERESFIRLIEYKPAGPVFELAGLDDLIEKAQTHNAVLHLFAHGGAQKLRISDTEEIDAIDLSIRLEKLAGRLADEDNQSHTLVFLNACNSSIADLDDGFFQAASQEGVCGFIGTEAEVPAELAIRIGQAFLDRVVHRGMSVGQAFQEIHTEYWPYSLLYSCYATADFRVQAAA